MCASLYTRGKYSTELSYTIDRKSSYCRWLQTENIVKSELLKEALVLKHKSKARRQLQNSKNMKVMS